MGVSLQEHSTVHQPQTQGGLRYRITTTIKPLNIFPDSINQEISLRLKTYSITHTTVFLLSKTKLYLASHNSITHVLR